MAYLTYIVRRMELSIFLTGILVPSVYALACVPAYVYVQYMIYLYVFVHNLLSVYYDNVSNFLRMILLTFSSS